MINQKSLVRSTKFGTKGESLEAVDEDDVLAGRAVQDQQQQYQLHTARRRQQSRRAVRKEHGETFATGQLQRQHMRGQARSALTGNKQLERALRQRPCTDRQAAQESGMAAVTRAYMIR